MKCASNPIPVLSLLFLHHPYILLFRFACLTTQQRKRKNDSAPWQNRWNSWNEWLTTWKEDRKSKNDSLTDIESYLTTFERMMQTYEIDASNWLHWQGSRALKAQTYPSVKSAILRRYNINEGTYRKRFRALSSL